ncbi:uncharacterized protein LOC105837404 isoform X1 [Monomorium pharaonis]|uniref:uncharacterized protein LOC105837404 isoform X1 n=1 Tax=Monomorium pharaonis TaxID=307658 RepID=UPI00063FB4D6|nr:uncharacterized protein LOC105837404 isoform X1 [Monomorium pharaonis]
MKRLLLFALLIYTVSALSCVAHDKKGKPDIQVIEVDDSSKGGRADIQIIDVDDSSKGSGSSDIQVIEVDDSSKGSNEVVALHLPNRRRREVTKSKKNKHICKKDSDCGPGYICLANVACVKGKRRIISSVKVKDKN